MDTQSIIGTSTEICQTMYEYSTSTDYLKTESRNRTDGVNSFTEIATTTQPILTTSTVNCYNAKDQYSNYMSEILIFGAVVVFLTWLFKN